MKALRILAIVVGSLVVLAGLCVALALTPAVQTWAVRKFAGDQPGMKLEVGRVAAGFSAANVTDLRVARNGAVITARGVNAHYVASDYLLHHRINADDVTIDDLEIDLRAAMSPAGATAGSPSGAGSAAPRESTAAAAAKRPSAASPPSPFNGLLSEMQLPFDVRVAKLSARGRALLPADRVVNFELHGESIETGQRGKLDWKIDFTDPKPDAPVATLATTGNATLHLTADRRIDLIEISSLATAHGPRLPTDQLKLEAKAEKAATSADENYALAVNLLRGATTEPLLKSTARYQAAAHGLDGTWELTVKSEQLAALLSGLGLPEIAADGAGKFTFQPTTNAITANGEVHGTASHLEKLAPELATIGAMQFRTAFDGGLADNVARLERLQLEATAADGRKLAQIDTLQRVEFSLADKRVSLANPQADLARISVQALPLAWAQPFVKAVKIESGDVSLVLAVEAEPDGSHVRTKTIEPLTARAVTLRSGDKKLVEQLTLSVAPRIDYSSTHIVAQLADLKISLPAGDALSGSVDADITNPGAKSTMAFSAQLQGKIVAALKAYLPVDPGPLALASNVSGRLEGDMLQVAKFSATVTREAGGVLAALELQQPLRADLKQSKFSVANPEATAAKVRLGEVPLAWAEAFVPKSQFAGTLAGAAWDVSFRSVDDVTLNTTEPLVARGVSATLDGKPMVQALDLTTDFTATKHADALSYDVRRLEVKQGNASLATLTVAGSAKLGAKLAVTAKGNLDADVAALMNQPGAAGFATLSRGRLTTAFDANLAETLEAKATVSAKGLVARQNNQPLGDLELTLTATAKPDGNGTLVAPLTLTNANRRSDVTVEGAYGRAPNQQAFLFTGRITSNELYVDDFQPLAGLAPGGEKPNPPSSPSAKRDTVPFWNAVRGKVSVDLKKIIYGRDYTISGVHGGATITDTRLALDSLTGQFNQNPFKADAAVAFTAAQPKPYTLTGSTDVQNFDVGALLRAANPNEKPMLESQVTVTAKLNGTGATLPDLAKSVYGQFDVTGSKGVTRMFGSKTNFASLGSTALQLGGLLTNSSQTVNIGQVAAALAELDFDSFKLHVERGADLRFKVSNVEFISPLMRTTGNGTIANQPNIPVLQQPMEILLQFGAKGQLADLLAKAGVLGDQSDDKGYRLLQRAFTLGGTPGSPDSRALYRYLEDELKHRAIDVLPGLLNRVIR